MRLENPILGGGLSGRIASAITGGVILEAKEFPSVWHSPGLFYLHPSEYMYSFLTETLGFKVHIVDVRSAIVYDKHIEPTRRISKVELEAILDAYSKKTRGVPYAQLPKNDSESIMNFIVKDSHPKRYNLDVADLWERLIEVTDCRTIYGVKVRSVSKGELETSFGRIDFEEALSTLPLDTLAPYGSDLHRSSSKSYYFRVYPKNILDYDYIYLVGPEYRATRWVNANTFDALEADDIVILETKGTLDSAMADLDRLGYKEWDLLDVVTNRYKNLSGDGMPYIDDLFQQDVLCIGRLAKWSNNLLLNDLVAEVLSIVNN